MSNEIQGIDALLPPELLDANRQPIEKCLYRTLVIEGCRAAQGDKGPYYRVFVADPISGEKFTIATGAAAIVDSLAYLAEHHLFPVRAQIEKRGRAYVLASPEA